MTNLGWGLSWGISFGIVYAVFGGALYALGGAAAKAKYGLGTATVLGLYLFGGVAAGLFVGLCRPMLRSRAGAMLVGIAVATFIAALYTTLSHGWSPAGTSGVIVYGVGFGALAGAKLWKSPPSGRDGSSGP